MGETTIEKENRKMMGSRARARVKEKTNVELGFGMSAGRKMNEGLGTHLGPDR